jgi:hypothetical protein
MAKFAWTNASVWGGGFDYSGQSNSIAVTTEVTTLDVTTFGSGGWQENIGGLKSYTMEMSGFWESGTGTTAVDPYTFAQLGQTQQLFFVAPGTVAGQVGYAFNGMDSTYQLGGEVGTAAPFTINGVATTPWPEVRGQIAAAKGSVSATGALGSVLTLGAAGTGQRLYAGVHVFSPGTTVTVQVQSASTVGFASPTTRATFPAITAQGGTWLTPVDGPITDQYFRLNVSAITGTFVLGAWIAVQ